MKSLLLLFILPAALFGQSIKGTWKGELTQDIGAPYTDYYFRMDLEVQDGKVSGSSKIQLKSDSSVYGVMSITGTFKDSALTFQESVPSESTIKTENFSWCIKKGVLYLTKEGDDLYLKGNWEGKVPWGPCKPGTISIRNTDDTQADPEEQKLEDRDVIGGQKVFVSSDSITIKLYDHKRIDNDIISLKFNGELIVKNYVLKGKPLIIKLKINKNASNPLVMYAHNLGKIPPNTAALEVLDDKNKQKLKLQSNLKESDSVDIIYKP